MASRGIEGAVNAVGVVDGSADLGQTEPGVPYPSGLVANVVERDGEPRHCRSRRVLGGLEQQQGDRGGMAGVQGEVEDLLRLDPVRSERQRRAVNRLPVARQLRGCSYGVTVTVNSASVSSPPSSALARST